MFRKENLQTLDSFEFLDVVAVRVLANLIADESEAVLRIIAVGLAGSGHLVFVLGAKVAVSTKILLQGRELILGVDRLAHLA